MGKNAFTEAEAATALVRGNEAGLNYFFELYYTPLLWFSLRLTSERSAAEDIVTEAFLTLWNNRDEIRTPIYIKHYLYRVVQNAAIDLIRLRKKKSVRNEEFQYLSPASDNNVLARLIETEFHHQVYLTLNNLPPRMGKVFRMFYLQGKSCQQIAEELQVSIHTVRNQRLRALELLRQNVLTLVLLLLFI